MDFTNFGLSRDLLYLTFLFAGAALGAVLFAYSRKTTLRHRSGWISAALCCGSGVIAAAAGAAIASRGAVFAVPALFVPAAVFFVLSALAVRFPRVVGCTVIFVAGIAVVALGLGFLRFPLLEAGAESITAHTEGNGELTIRRFIGASGNSRTADTWTVRDDGTPLEFEAVSVTADRRYPVFGGEARGFFTRVGRGRESLFQASRSLVRNAARAEAAGSAGFAGRTGFSFRQFSAVLPAEAILPGVTIEVLFDGTTLYFDPPIIVGVDE